jgi:hypothetical protein
VFIIGWPTDIYVVGLVLNFVQPDDGLLVISLCNHARSTTAGMNLPWHEYLCVIKINLSFHHQCTPTYPGFVKTSLQMKLTVILQNYKRLLN